MVDTDISSIAGTTMGIMGMGLGLGILARTARNIEDTMNEPRTVRRIQHKHKKQPYTTMQPKSRVMRHYTDNYWGI